MEQIEEIRKSQEIEQIIHSIPDVCDNLKKRVLLATYCRKLEKKAYNCVLKKDDKKMVFASMYVNDLNTHVAYISLISCFPDCRRKGYGSKMFEFLCDYAKEKGMETIRLEVAKDNLPAIAFYHRHGMHTVSKTESSFYMEKTVEQCHFGT